MIQQLCHAYKMTPNMDLSAERLTYTEGGDPLASVASDLRAKLEPPASAGQRTDVVLLPRAVPQRRGHCSKRRLLAVVDFGSECAAPDIGTAPSACDSRSRPGALRREGGPGFVPSIGSGRRLIEGEQL